VRISLLLIHSSLVLKSILDAVMHCLLLKKSLKCFIKDGGKVYCAFIDASKAFDKVLHNGLFSMFECVNNSESF